MVGTKGLGEELRLWEVGDGERDTPRLRNVLVTIGAIMMIGAQDKLS